MKKRILSLLLCLVMALSLMPTSAFAEQSKVTCISFSGLIGPIIGEKPVKTVNSHSEKYSVSVITWCKKVDDADIEMTADEVFEEGQKYCAVLRAETTDGFYFSNNPAEMEIDPINCSLPSDYRVGGLDYHSASNHDIYMITLMFDSAMSAGREKISEVKLDSVVFPEIGKIPSKSVKSLNEGAYDVSLLGWAEDGTGTQDLMASDDKFKAGKTYYAIFNLSIQDGYLFDVPDNLTLTLNGKEIASDAVDFSPAGKNGLGRMIVVKFEELPAIKFEDLPETGVTNITVSEGDEEIGTAIKDAIVLYCKDNIKADGEYAFIDYRFEDGGTFYHTWIITIQGDNVTAADGSSSNLAAILAAVNDPNPIYDWWINGTYTADTAVTEYDVWVSGTRVTSDNMTDVLGDSKVSYDPESKTLTVAEGANITGNYNGAMIYTTDTGELTIDGNLTLNGGNSVLYGVYSGFGNVEITGDADITVTATNATAIYAKDVAVGGSAKLTAAGDCWHALHADTGNITVGGDVTVEGSFKYGLYALDGNIEVTGNVTATVAESGLYTYNVITVNGDVDITHTGTDGEYPIWANKDVNIDGKAKFKAIGSCDKAVYSKGSITVGDDVTVTGNFTHGLYAKEGDLKVNGNVTGTVAQSALYASKAVTVNGDVDITHTATNGNYPIEANGGDVTITGKAKLNATGSCFRAVYSRGSITVGGDVTVEGSFKHGLYAKEGDLKVNGNVTAAVAESGLYAADKGITVNGDVDITHTGTDGDYPIWAKEDVNIGGKAKFKDTGSCDKDVYSGGSITVGGDVTIEGSFKYGLYALDGNIEVTGNVTATVAESGLYTYKGITVTGDVDITRTGTKTNGEYPIWAKEDVNIGGKAKIKATGSCYRAVYSKGSITVGGDVTVEGSFKYGLYAENKVTVVSGTWDIEVSECAIAADGEIIIPETHEVTTPEDGVITEITVSLDSSYYTVTESDGETPAKHVVIERSYTVTFDANGGSVTPISATTGAAGKLVSLPTPTRSGSYRFNGWYTAASGGTKVTVDKVYTADTTIYAHWTYTGGGGGGYIPVIYTLTFNTNGGSAISSVSGTYGKVIDLDKYVPTKSGFDFGGWYSDSALTDPVDEIKLNGNKTVYAKWNKANPNTGAELPFTDVKEADWSYEDIAYVYEKGLMQGTSETTFAPKTNTSRAMIVTILWRLEGEPIVNYAMSFDDVADGQWYTEAIRWAQANNIVNGYSAEKFGPTDLITREQMAAIFYRYAEFKGYDVSAKADLSKFADSDKISGWALDAIAWANANNLVNGVSTTELAPQGKATREQVAAILHRFCENIVK